LKNNPSVVYGGGLGGVGGGGRTEYSVDKSGPPLGTPTGPGSVA